MKNIQIIDGASNCVYDIFSATDEEFSLIFPKGTDIAFIDEIYDRENNELLDAAFNNIWSRRVDKFQVAGIHGTIFYELEEKKIYYPTRRDLEAVSFNGTPLR
ncbi:hypothetical protein [Pseudomonas caspiana]|uniref:hypothetical protein n=1 Tax=Pseudomonas caspiana TaxID=1451454 RepID=UPI0032EFAEE4